MAKQVKQFRYYKDNDPKNYPSGLSSEGLSGISFRNLQSGSLFTKYTPIIQLGIQTYPGVKFYLNNGETPIIVGYTGIYELNVEGIADISSLKFDGMSLNQISKNDGAYLIIDIIYEDGED